MKIKGTVEPLLLFVVVLQTLRTSMSFALIGNGHVLSKFSFASKIHNGQALASVDIITNSQPDDFKKVPSGNGAMNAISLLGMVEKNQFVIMKGASNGKTSTLQILPTLSDGWKFQLLHFHHRSDKAYICLERAGVDLRFESLSEEAQQGKVMILLDDCHHTYHEIGFWQCLLKNSFLFPNVHFVLSTKYLPTDPEIAPLFNALPKFSQPKPTREQAMELIKSKLPPYMARYQTLLDTIVAESNGHFGSLASLADFLNRFHCDNLVSEKRAIESLFDPWRGFHSGMRAQKLFNKDFRYRDRQRRAAFVAEVENGEYKKSTPDGYIDIDELIACGILTMNEVGKVEFTSPLAKRVFLA